MIERRSRAKPAQGGAIVIGYGSSLRRDDAVGLLVAEAVQAWNRDDVTGYPVPQLTPELAEPLSSARLAIFVDASADPQDETVHLRSISAAPVDSGWKHTANPSSLMALAQATFGMCARSWLITIPAPNLDFGEGLSPITLRGKAEALQTIETLLNV